MCGAEVVAIEILRNLTRRRLRSGLTVFGILIGVLAMTAMGAIAERFDAQFAAGAGCFGSNVQVRGGDARPGVRDLDGSMNVR
jgi:hypothetical protein